jgi:hypothetical protein
VGEILALLQELGIEKETLVFFSGDNGGADYFRSEQHPRGIHGANTHPETGVEYRGKKGNLYEGGLRIPFIARWPGRIPAGRVSDHLGYFPDILPTIAEVTKATPPADIDGISLLPELIGPEAAGHAQSKHDYLYWELSGWTAIRQGDWRAVKPARADAWELYNVVQDPSESNDLGKAQPDVLSKLVALAESAHEPVREGTFRTTQRHERDRRAKFGKHDQPDPPAANKSLSLHKMPTEGMLSNADWRIVRCSSENTGNQKYAGNAIDGDPTTVWHTRFSGGAAPPPHELLIDLGADRTIRGFVYLGRQDGSWNGAIKDIEFSVGALPDQFGTPVVKATLKKAKSPQTVSCDETRGRYVLLRAHSEYSPDPTFATVAELGVIGE